MSLRIPGYEVLDRAPWRQGGVASLYRGRRLSDGSGIVIKVLKTEMLRNRLIVQAFRQEYVYAHRIGQFNDRMADAYEYGKLPDGRPYFTMKQIHGEDVGSILRRAKREGTRVSLRLACRIIEESARLLDGLSDIFGRSIVHRDISPDNILVDIHGEKVYLIDFGIASGLDGAAVKGGKKTYTPPEGFHHVSSVYDVYSLGLVFFELLTGKSPGKYVDTDRAGRKICNMRDCDNVPPWLCELVSRMTNPDPRKRIQPREVARSLVHAQKLSPSTGEIDLVRDESREEASSPDFSFDVAWKAAAALAVGMFFLAALAFTWWLLAGVLNSSKPRLDTNVSTPGLSVKNSMMFQPLTNVVVVDVPELGTKRPKRFFKVPREAQVSGGNKPELVKEGPVFDGYSDLGRWGEELSYVIGYAGKTITNTLKYPPLPRRFAMATETNDGVPDPDLNDTVPAYEEPPPASMKADDRETEISTTLPVKHNADHAPQPGGATGSGSGGKVEGGDQKDDGPSAGSNAGTSGNEGGGDNELEEQAKKVELQVVAADYDKPGYPQLDIQEVGDEVFIKALGNNSREKLVAHNNRKRTVRRRWGTSLECQILAVLAVNDQKPVLTRLVDLNPPKGLAALLGLDGLDEEKAKGKIGEWKEYLNEELYSDAEELVKLVKEPPVHLDVADSDPPGKPAWPYVKWDPDSTDAKLISIAGKSVEGGSTLKLSNSPWGSEVSYKVQNAAGVRFSKKLSLNPPEGLKKLLGLDGMTLQEAEERQAEWADFLDKGLTDKAAALVARISASDDNYNAQLSIQGKWKNGRRDEPGWPTCRIDEGKTQGEKIVVDKSEYTAGHSLTGHKWGGTLDYRVVRSRYYKASDPNAHSKTKTLKLDMGQAVTNELLGNIQDPGSLVERRGKWVQYVTDDYMGLMDRVVKARILKHLADNMSSPDAWLGDKQIDWDAEYAGLQMRDVKGLLEAVKKVNALEAEYEHLPGTTNKDFEFNPKASDEVVKNALHVLWSSAGRFEEVEV
ncbi:MAG: serine/threonine protein kinase, partial [Verrucomicrobiota bacterium]